MVHVVTHGKHSPCALAQLAGALRTLGLSEGGRVGVILAVNSDRYLELYYAIPWAGAV